MPCCSHQISGLVSLPSADCNLLAALMAADLMRLDNCVKARLSDLGVVVLVATSSCLFSLKVVSTVWLMKIRHEKTHLEGRALLPEIYQRCSMACAGYWIDCEYTPD